MKISKFLFSIMFVFIATALSAQIAQDSTVFNLRELIDGLGSVDSWTGALMYEFTLTTMITLAIGYLSPIIPVLNKISNTAIRVLILFVLYVSVIINTGFDVNVLIQVVSYFFATRVVYDGYLKKTKPTSKPDEGVAGVFTLKNAA